MTTPLIPMRYESVEPDVIDGVPALPDFLYDPWWVVEQKLDGMRILANCHRPGVIESLTHGGRHSSRTSWLAAPLEALKAPQIKGWVLDGEVLAEGVYWLFDAPVYPTNEKAPPFAKRREVLVKLYDFLVEQKVPGWGDSIRLVGQATTRPQKRKLWTKVLDTGAEGVCAKRIDGKYLMHKSRRSRDVIKVKVTHTVDCVVLRSRDTNSVALGLYRDGELVECGAASMNGKTLMAIGSCCEVRYLYQGVNGRLYQPTILRRRPDKIPTECTWEQLSPIPAKEVIGA